MPDDARCFSDAETLLSETLRQREQVGRADGRCFSDAETLREQAGKPFRQSLMGETTADASSRETRPTHCLPNALPPLGASLSMREKTALPHQRTASPTHWLPDAPFPIP